MIFDVAVIGAGVTGCMTARELSKLNLRVALLERCNDVAMGTTKANSAIVHAGYDAVPGSLKARLNVRGTAMMPSVCAELSVPFKQIGSFVVAFSEDEKATLEALLNKGIENGVEGLEIIDGDALRKAEPNLSDKAVAALYAPSAGIVCPYELTIAAAENAVMNGVEFIRNFAVKSIKREGGYLTVSSGEKEIKAKYVVNAAGVYCDEIAAMTGDNSLEIVSRKGEYMLCDKTMGTLVNHVIFQCPNPMGKGSLLAPTVDGNLIVGPSATDIDSKEDVSTSSAVLEKILETSRKSVPTLTTREVITSFSGLRAHSVTDDFIIGKSEKEPCLINVAGIESPGLSAAPATAEMVAGIINAELKAEPKADYIPGRKPPVRFRNLSNGERKALIEKDPAYGRIICRCETVTEGEILDAIRAPAGARDVDGVKRRTRAGMGRCQGGFCGSKVVELLARELGTEINEITKCGGDSKILYERTK